MDNQEELKAHLIATDESFRDLSNRHAQLKQGMTDIVLGEAKRYGWKVDTAAIIDILGGDIDLNAQGLAIWYDSTTKGNT